MRERCSKCILSSSFPGIEFNEAGVCNVCRGKMFSTTSEKMIESAREAVENLLREKKGSARYDAVLCNSGGKDSIYTLMIAVQEYKLKVLSFTLDNGFLAAEAIANIERVVDRLGVDHITVKPASTFFRDAIKAAALHTIYSPKTLTRISAGCNTCISLVNITALKLALDFRAPFIIAGFTLGQIPINALIFKNNYRFLQESREPVLERLREHVGPRVDNYYCIDDETIAAVKSYPTNINLLCLKDVTEDEIVREIEPLGWRRPVGIDGCSSNCRLNTFNNYIHEQKFGYNPYELELSQLIRKGLMTREEALVKVNDQPLELLQDILSQLDISSGELAEAAQHDPSPEPT